MSKGRTGWCVNYHSYNCAPSTPHRCCAFASPLLKGLNCIKLIDSLAIYLHLVGVFKNILKNSLEYLGGSSYYKDAENINW